MIEKKEKLELDANEPHPRNEKYFNPLGDDTSPREIEFVGIKGIECIQQVALDGNMVSENPKTPDWDFIRVPKGWSRQWCTVVRHTIKSITDTD